MKKYFAFPLFIIALACGQPNDKTVKEANVSIDKSTSSIASKKEVAQNIKISGKMSASDNKNINLYKLVGGNRKQLFKSFDADLNGKFSLSITIDQPDFFVIAFPNGKEKTLVLYDSDIQINVGNEIKVSGSSDTDNLDKFLDMDRRLMAKMGELKNAYQVATNKAVAETNYNNFINSAIKELTLFIKNHNNSIVAILAAQKIDTDNNIKILSELSSNLKSKYPTSQMVKRFTSGIEATLKTAIGQPAPEITLSSPDGKEIKLSSLKGKYVMIDFWASWCGPCRRENPNVVRMYNKYKDKGFEIYGVSLDKSKDSWTKAIQNDGLEWLHVSDLKHWQSIAAQAYKVDGIPMTYLIDKSGIIIAKNLRGASLDAKLAEVLQ